MLHLLFRLGSDLHAIPAVEIDKVLPLPELVNLSQAPPCVAGLLRYQGDLVPVLDVNLLRSGTPCRPVASTRIILVGARECRLGLMVEQALDMLDLQTPQPLAPELIQSGHDWLRPAVYDSPLGLVRSVLWPALLTPELRALADAPGLP